MKQNRVLTILTISNVQTLDAAMDLNFKLKVLNSVKSLSQHKLLRFNKLTEIQVHLNLEAEYN